MPQFDREARTEPPTPRRRQEARERGQVAKSQDLNVALLLAAVFSGLYFFGLPSFEKIAQMSARILGSMADFKFDLGSLVHIFSWTLGGILAVILPLVGLAFLVSVAANMVQVGFLFTGEPLKPDLSKVDPFRGLGRIFSLRGLAKILFGTFKIAVVGGVLIWTLWDELSRPEGENILLLLQGSGGDSLIYTLKVVLIMGFRGVVALLVVALFDYAYQKWQYEKDLMMTKQEVREELLRMEGNPKIKERRKKIQQQIAYQRMMQAVLKADVVITNPTHYAVAIQYERESMSAPRCLAKGKDYVAQRIREIALENGVAVVERPELARGLFQTVEVGQEIPPEFYRAVAEVLAYVYRIANRPVAAGQEV